MCDVESSLMEDGAASSDKSTKQAIKSPSESPASSKAGTSQQVSNVTQDGKNHQVKSLKDVAL